MLLPFLGASLHAIALASAVPVEDDPQQRPDIVVIADRTAATPRATVDAEDIATTVNAMNVEDTIKYLPSLIVRKRHIGDTQAPLATRTSGLGASARSLIYADGALLSALIGNNNTSASPRWSLVSPQEIARIDVLYGPFSAAYPGNSIGAVVNITTRLPDELEGDGDRRAPASRLTTSTARRDTLPAYQARRDGRRPVRPARAVRQRTTMSTSRGQPLGYVTAVARAGERAGTPVTGGFDDLNRTGAADPRARRERDRASGAGPPQAQGRARPDRGASA